MIDFKNSVLGFVMFVLGVLFLIYTIRSKQKDGKDQFGNLIEMYFGAIGLILMGLFLFIREFIKIW